MSFTLAALALSTTLSLGGPDPDTVTITYDTYGVPHVVGCTDEAAYYGLGYASARDRWFQMNLRRLRARGKLASYLGAGLIMNKAGDLNDAVLQSDIVARTLGIAERADRAVAELSATDMEVYGLMDAYTRGINRYVQVVTDQDTSVDPLGPGAGFDPMFGIYEIDPTDPWTMEDTVLAWLDNVREFNSNFAADIANAKVAEQVPDTNDRRKMFFPDYKQVDRTAAIRLEDVSQAYVDGVQGYADALMAYHYPPLETDDPYDATFSNALAVRGALVDFGSTDVGDPEDVSVLLGTPRTQLFSPTQFYEWHMQGETFNVRGAGFAGTPNLVSGFTDAAPGDQGFVPVSWSMTSCGADVVDLFEVQLNASGSSYTLDGQKQSLLVNAKEFIKVRKNPGVVPAEYSEVQITRRETIFGPLVTDLPAIANKLASFTPPWDDREFAMAWTYTANAPLASSADPSVALLAMYRSSGSQEFLQSVNTLYSYPCANMVIADGEGNVGFTVTGDVPVRRPGTNEEFKWAALLPSDGTSSASLWQEYIRPQHRPQAVNPVRGYFQSANHSQVGSWYPLASYYDLGGDKERSYTLRRLMEEAASNQALVSVSDISGLTKSRSRVVVEDVTEILFSALGNPATQGLLSTSAGLIQEMEQWRLGGSGLDGQSLAAAVAFYFSVGNPQLRAENWHPSVPSIPALSEKYGSRVRGAHNLIEEALRGIRTGARPTIPAGELALFEAWLLSAEGTFEAFYPPASNPVPLAAFHQDYYTPGSDHVPDFNPSSTQQPNSVHLVGKIPRWGLLGLAGRIPVNPAGLPGAPPKDFFKHTEVVRSVLGKGIAHSNAAVYNQFVILGPDVVDRGKSLLGGGQSEKEASPHSDDQMQRLALGKYKPAPISPAGVAAGLPTNPIVIHIPSLD